MSLVNSTCECNFAGIDHPKKILCEEEKTPSQKLQAKSSYDGSSLDDSPMSWGVNIGDHQSRDRNVLNGDQVIAGRCGG